MSVLLARHQTSGCENICSKGVQLVFRLLPLLPFYNCKGMVLNPALCVHGFCLQAQLEAKEKQHFQKTKGITFEGAASG